MAQALNENPSVKPDEIYPEQPLSQISEPAGSEMILKPGNNGPVVPRPEPQHLRHLNPQTPQTPADASDTGHT